LAWQGDDEIVKMTKNVLPFEETNGFDTTQEVVEIHFEVPANTRQKGYKIMMSKLGCYDTTDTEIERYYENGRTTGSTAEVLTLDGAHDPSWTIYSRCLLPSVPGPVYFKAEAAMKPLVNLGHLPREGEWVTFQAKSKVIQNGEAPQALPAGTVPTYGRNSLLVKEPEHKKESAAEYVERMRRETSTLDKASWDKIDGIQD